MWLGRNWGLRSYLWGMETAMCPHSLHSFQNPLRSYLWGMETGKNIKGVRDEWDTPILPMRHGNRREMLKKLRSAASLRSYLWGMETRLLMHPPASWDQNSDPTYEAWKLSMSIEAFCHSFLLRSYLWGMETALIVPCPWIGQLRLRSYLWGMETCAPIHIRFQLFHSDPTYEAWKLFGGISSRTYY